jgi:flavin reductase (DIM6/NTAB) family NADH-FMN oxidoreductase RutF
MGIPLIVDSVAQFECITHATYPGGDHEICVGRVINYTYNNIEPLILSKGKIINS